MEKQHSDEDFRKHYRMSRKDFQFILNRIRGKLDRGFSYQARNCGMKDAAMTPEQMLDTLLKHLGDSLQHDNNYHYKFHRSTIQRQLYKTMSSQFPVSPLKTHPSFEVWQRNGRGEVQEVFSVHVWGRSTDIC